MIIIYYYFPPAPMELYLPHEHPDETSSQNQKKKQLFPAPADTHSHYYRSKSTPTGRVLISRVTLIPLGIKAVQPCIMLHNGTFQANLSAAVHDRSLMRKTTAPRAFHCQNAMCQTPLFRPRLSFHFNISAVRQSGD